MKNLLIIGLKGPSNLGEVFVQDMHIVMQDHDVIGMHPQFDVDAFTGQ
jgi:hypothetical protein